VAVAFLLGSLTVVSGAAAKEFRPGEVKICNGTRCIPLSNPTVLRGLASFYYDGARRPARAPAPSPGAPSLRLEFSNGYVSGIVAGEGLDRFLSGGVNLDQFHAGVWYRVPSDVLAGLRRSSAGLTLQPLTATLTGTGPSLGPSSHPSSRGPQPVSEAASDSLLLGLAAVSLAVLIGLALRTSRRRRAVPRRSPTVGTH
jgi:hypothetical protein